MKVLKFGGTSVKFAQNINQVIDIVSGRLDGTGDMVVVVSASGGVTGMLIEVSQCAARGDENYTELFKDIEKRHLDNVNNLINVRNRSSIIAKVKIMLNDLENLLTGVFLLRELSPKSLDLVMSFGERMSAYIISQVFNDRGISAHFTDSRDLIRTDRNFNNAKVDFLVTNKQIADYFAIHKGLHVVPGFIGSSADGETTTIGRGGSDYTGAIYAGALKVSNYEIWTDVDGMMTADPRFVRKAFLINKISYHEALELSHFGSKVIFSQTFVPTAFHKFNIWIKNTFKPHVDGTLIMEQNTDPSVTVRGISWLDDVALFTVQGSGIMGVSGIASRLFGAVSRASINVILITQASSEHSITFAIPEKESQLAKESIDREFESELKLGYIEPVSIDNNLAIVAIVGENMKNTPGISARLFGALGRNGISVIATAQGASELNISAVIGKQYKQTAMNAIHEEFFLSDTKTINLFMVGTGKIGVTLLKQLNEQATMLKANNNMETNVIGIINTGKMLINEQGINLLTWEQEFEDKGIATNLDDFIAKIKSMNLRNSIFIDNTSSNEVVQHYTELLQANISVVAANKVANTLPYPQYRDIHNAANRYGVHFLYETNVGAGLPIINTLKDFVRSGDQILRIEAILNGTLNFIFSNLSEKKSFSQCVAEAVEQKLTEPDVRDDLSGFDAARKLLILLRETGSQLNMEQLDTHNCLTPETMHASTPEAFWASLEKVENPYYAQRFRNAAANGKRLKYIAVFDGQRAYTQLAEVEASHPFYKIDSCDNIVAFTTMRYGKNPLIIYGPGAGAEVTAAGLFADIVRVVNN